MASSVKPSKSRWLLLFVVALLILALGGRMIQKRLAAAETLQGMAIFPSGTHVAANFSLRDQHGHLVRLSAEHNRIIALTFLDSYCTEQCPVVARQLAQVQQALGTSVPFTTLIISVAPYHDTPASAQAFAHKAGWSGDWRWLFGSTAQLQPIWRAYGIYVQITPPASPIFQPRYNLVHTATVYLIDHKGDVRAANLVPLVTHDLIQSARILHAAVDTSLWGQVQRLF